MCGFCTRHCAGFHLSLNFKSKITAIHFGMACARDPPDKAETHFWRTAMDRFFVCLFILTSVVLSTSANRIDPVEPGPQPEKHRIGVYDSRAIAIAWAGSKFNSVGDKMKELEAAKKAGDKNKIAELEAWGAAHQRLLHFQGFGRVPVGELLKPVEDRLIALMDEKKLLAITMQCDALSANTETVDITLDLVRLYDPPARVLTWVEQLKDKAPVSLVELADMPANK
jgi:hypothetical protein